MSINWIDYNGYDFLPSTYVKVYPSAYRGTDASNNQLDPKAVLNLEENIIKAANAGFPGVKANSSSENSYIISWTNDGELKCVIAGYYFEIINFKKSDLTDAHRYATIKLTNATITEDIGTKILSPITGPGDTSANEDPGATMILDYKPSDGKPFIFIGLAFTSNIETEETELKRLDLLAPESNYKLSYTEILSNANGTVSSITGNIVDGTGELSIASLYKDSNNNINNNIIKNTATKIGAHAEGYDTTASGDYSHAEGSGTTASGDYSHAEGLGTNAIGDYSHAEGHGTKAVANNSLAIGKYNIGKSDTLFEIGCGAGNSSSQRKNIFEVTADEVRIGIGNNVFGNHVFTVNATTRETTVDGNLSTGMHIQVNDDNDQYTGADNFNSADIDTRYYSKGITAEDAHTSVTYNYSFPNSNGTLATQEWTNSNFVHNSGSEPIDGEKTFTSAVTINNKLTANGNINAQGITINGDKVAINAQGITINGNEVATKAYTESNYVPKSLAKYLHQMCLQTITGTHYYISFTFLSYSSDSCKDITIGQYLGQHNGDALIDKDIAVSGVVRTTSSNWGVAWQMWIDNFSTNNAWIRYIENGTGVIKQESISKDNLEIMYHSATSIF